MLLVLLQHRQRRTNHIRRRTARTGMFERAAHGFLGIILAYPSATSARTASAETPSGFTAGPPPTLRPAKSFILSPSSTHSRSAIFLPDARHALQRREIAIADRAHHPAAAERGDQSERERRGPTPLAPSSV